MTVLVCSNRTGNHKLRLTFIGISNKPRAFKKIKKTRFPILPLLIWRQYIDNDADYINSLKRIIDMLNIIRRVYEGWDCIGCK